MHDVVKASQYAPPAFRQRRVPDISRNVRLVLEPDEERGTEVKSTQRRLGRDAIFK
jgi:hypothetical protein